MSYSKLVDVSSLEETVDGLSKYDWLRGLFVAVDNKCHVGVSRSLCSQRQHFPFLTYVRHTNP